MLILHVKPRKEDIWDPEREIFVRAPGGLLMLEHSLISISKWESKYHKPFLAKNDKDTKTADEMRYYVECMTVNNVDPDIYNSLTVEDIQQVGDYISDPMTATTITDHRRNGAPPRRNTEVITSELIYYHMIEYGIPFECEKWHLNRLLMLIRVCNVKAASGNSKMSTRDIMAQNKALNAARRAKYHSKG